MLGVVSSLTFPELWTSASSEDAEVHVDDEWALSLKKKSCLFFCHYKPRPIMIFSCLEAIRWSFRSAASLLRPREACEDGCSMDTSRNHYGNVKHLPPDARRRVRISLLPHAFSSPSTFFPLLSVLHLRTCAERNGTESVHKWSKNKSGRKELPHLRDHLAAVWLASLILPAADSQVELISSTIQSTICNSARCNSRCQAEPFFYIFFLFC